MKFHKAGDIELGCPVVQYLSDANHDPNFFLEHFHRKFYFLVSITFIADCLLSSCPADPPLVSCNSNQADQSHYYQD